MNRHPSFLRDTVLRWCKHTGLCVTRLHKSLQQKVGSLYRYVDDACYRFWKYPIPRRIQRVYDMTCLYGKLLPSYLTVLFEELKILFTEGIRRFWFVHNMVWNERWPLNTITTVESALHSKFVPSGHRPAK
jgi:hypothetical protein